MQNKTSKQLLASVLALALCCVMLLGTTFAWFTDTATTAVSSIQSGTLKVDLVDANDATLVGQTLNFLSNGTEKTDILWEPGCTYNLEDVYIKNEGNLALKYRIEISGIEGDAKLLEAIDWTVELDGNEIDLDTFTGNLAPNTKSGLLKLTGHMDENAGNEYQDLSITGIAITVYATQDTVEFDSIDNQYDAPAFGEVAFVTDETSMKEALAEGKNVTLSNDITVNSTMTVAANTDAVIDLNGNDISYAVANSGASAIINNKGNLDIVGEGTISFVAANPDMQQIPAYATNTITNTGSLTIGAGVVVTNGSDGGASYAVDNHGTFVLDGGTLIGDRCALRVAKYNTDNVSFVMESGRIKAKTPMWIQLPGSNANAAPNISVTINGGTIESTKASSADNNVMYTYSYGNSHANTSVTINGGEFLGGTVSIGSGYKGDAPALTINGGTFEYDVLQWLDGDQSNVLFAANK